MRRRGAKIFSLIFMLLQLSFYIKLSRSMELSLLQTKIWRRLYKKICGRSRDVLEADGGNSRRKIS